MKSLRVLICGFLGKIFQFESFAYCKAHQHYYHSFNGPICLKPKWILNATFRCTHSPSTGGLFNTWASISTPFCTFCCSPPPCSPCGGSAAYRTQHKYPYTTPFNFAPKCSSSKLCNCPARTRFMYKCVEHSA